MRVVGVDPGGRWTGVVGRDGGEVLAVEVLERADDLYRPGPDYLNLVLDTVARVRDELGATGRKVVVAVEDVTPPTGFARGRKSPIDPASIIGVATVLGAVLAVYPDVVVVRARHNGSMPLIAYPRALVGGPHNPRWPRPEPKGAGVLRHARSAWDVAGAAPMLHQLHRRIP